MRRVAAPRFRPALFRFLAELAENNRRDWFQAHKQRYEADVRGPALAFVAAFSVPLERISPHFEADPRPVGGSLFRIHRDVRFAKDKSPYKTSVGIQLRHGEGRDAHAPCFYLHLEPRNCFVGAGLWHPDPKTAGVVREAIAGDPKGWKAAAHGPAARRAGLRLAGDSYKRPPRGVEPDHPLLEDLLRKDFIFTRPLKQTDVTAAGFPKEFERLCRAGAALNRFLCGALGLPF